MIPKRAPGYARSSMGHSDPLGVHQSRVQVFSDPKTDPSLKHRFRTAYHAWAVEAGGTREEFADLLDVPFSAVKRWLSESDDRPVPAGSVMRAEALAASTRSTATATAIAEAAREYAAAHARLMELVRGAA